MAKGLGGGFPIGSMWVRENAADLFHPGSHGTTFGGTPLACAAALAVLDVIERDQLLAKINANSLVWHAALTQLVKDFPAQVLNVRGQGYLVGIQFASDVGLYQTALREAGLLVPVAGGNVIRLLPPLTSTAQELEQSTEILRKVLISRA
jgi:acetylornithine aminotransferase/acetylornithine/N-succinyldiaminopimelate aminotransferase